jgi:lysophospholipase L1-like esterase
MKQRFAKATAVILAAMSMSVMASAQQANSFEADIVRFEQADLLHPPDKGGVVFVGSSSIRLWSSLPHDFSELKVINRGFGGSTMADAVHFAHRIVTPYQPQLVVIFAGTNDIANGKKAEAILEDYRSFVRVVREKLPHVPIAYLSITPTPSRWSMVDEVRKTNRLIREYSESQQDLTFVDMFDRYLTDGKPRPELFVGDQLHMNEKGYAIWAEEIRPVLHRILGARR